MAALAARLDQDVTSRLLKLDHLGVIEFELDLKSSDFQRVQIATTTPDGEAPECAWCPLCRAARMVRESGPGMASQAAAVGDTVVALVQDRLSAFESALAAAGRTARPGAGPARADTVWADVTVQDPEEEPESTAPPGGPPHEPDDRG